MNNFKYLIIGVLLVGATIAVNHFLNGNGASPQQDSVDIVQNNEPASTETAPVETSGRETLSLRERILGQRESKQADSQPSQPKILGNEQSPFKLPSGERQLATSKGKEKIDNPANDSPAISQQITPIDEIVIPDFSNLETAILETDTLPLAGQTSPPRLLKIPDPPRLDFSDSNSAGQSQPEVNTTANKIKLPPSSAITPIRLTPKRDNSASVTPEAKRKSFSRATGIPFGLNQQARSELIEVSNRSEQIKPATTHFLDHKTKPGDSLQSLSDQYYGRPDFYLDIYIANQDKLVNPATVPPGMTIKIPIFQD